MRSTDMSTASVLIANRGEIAIRIARAAAELGMRVVAVHSDDDADSLHVSKADEALSLGAPGSAAYLDVERIVDAARRAGCTLVHPGYGFLSERAEFARRCGEAGLRFVGPAAATLETFGNKAAARELALTCDVPVAAGSAVLKSPDEARRFMASLGRDRAIVIKAVGGGGGRGIRVVRRADEIADAFARCQSEARAAFGNGDVYAEEFVEGARHVEVQVVGDGAGGVVVLGERECTLQRRHQKLVEVAPSPSLSPAQRASLFAAAERMARAVDYASLGTFEFLVGAPGEGGSDGRIVFIEANPRLQVEHTVTEAVTGLDLVQLQLRLAGGERLAGLGLDSARPALGQAMQMRINMERVAADGSVAPTFGTLSAFELPSGPGVRVDSCGYVGYRNNPSFDSLLAKLVVHTHSDDFGVLVRKAYRALCEVQIRGIETNLAFLQNLLRDPSVAQNRIHTRFVEENARALAAGSPDDHRRLYVPSSTNPEAAVARVEAPEGTVTVAAPTAGRVVGIDVGEGEAVVAGQQVAVLESMKTEFVVVSEVSGRVARISASNGDAVTPGSPLLFLAPSGDDGRSGAEADEAEDLELIRGDLARVMAAHEALQDAARPEAVLKRRETGQRTARENIDDLCDDGSFLEYGGFAVAAQRTRHPIEKLKEISPADGFIAGTATVNAQAFGASRSRCVVMAYDYTVFAGTQGYMAHEKKKRMLRLAGKWRLPVVLFAEGGGGRPGDTDHLGGLRLYNPTFWGFARLNGQVPIVGVVSGRCFAGNAALLSCCDVVIATENASIGMGGPAMIEGGGLGVVAPEAVGPVAVQARNGVIDVVVRDEAQAVDAAKRYLSYFQGALQEWDCADQRHLRWFVPEAPRRAYDMREVIATLADSGSVLELRAGYGVGVITALARIEGHAFAVLANNPAHLAGAIDAEASEKAARFLALADNFGLPVLSLCDTPGFMVGPEAEKTGLVRSAGRMFVSGARLGVPCFAIVVRKAYGLGALAMVGGNSHEHVFTVSWPTGHFGKMGLEGYVKLAYRKELARIEDPAERQARIDQMVAEMHERGTALNTAPFLSIDDVIDPAESRRWLIAGLHAARRSDGDGRDVAVPQGVW
ncbi:MAG: ATP-grasp domain-containing protein [Burkholderiaceae bacterium]|nr:ATP-grasp domain-containing protein [Burkholderiaceae bacterium]